MALSRQALRARLNIFFRWPSASPNHQTHDRRHQLVNRLTNLRHITRIDGIAAALHALGKHLDLRVV